IPLSSMSSSVPSFLSGLLPGLPIGAHMLTMRADHVEGPWHGGGWLKGPGNPNIDVNLMPLLNDFAKQSQTTQGDTFTYCAHPYGGQGWDDDKIAEGFGLDPAKFPRDRSKVHDATNKFVLKVLEFWNGRGSLFLDSRKVI